MNNIIRRSWNMYSMVNIEDLRGSAFQQEDGGHTFEITGLDANGNATALSGTVAAVFLRADNTDVAIVGSVSGGKVYVTLTDECYGYPGRFGLTIFLTSGGQKVAIYAAIGSVAKTSSGTVAPETGEDVADLIAAIEAAIASIPADYSSLWTSLAPEFSTSTAYTAGQYVTYNGGVYRFISNHSAGSWSSADAVLTNIGTDLGNELYDNVARQLYNPSDSNTHTNKRWNSGGGLADASGYTAVLIEAKAGEKYLANAYGVFTFFHVNSTTSSISADKVIIGRFGSYSQYTAPSDGEFLFTIAQGYEVICRVYDGIFVPDKKNYNYRDIVKVSSKRKPYSGISYVAIGDSITYYDEKDYINTTDVAGTYCKGYQSYIAEKLGFSKINMGYSGANSNYMRTQVLATDFSNVEVASIMTGMNDGGQSVPIATYKQNIIDMLIHISEDNPYCRIFLLSPTYGYFDHPQGAYPTGGVTRDYADAMKEVAFVYNIPFYDNMLYNGINYQNYFKYMADTISTTTYAIHPNAEGYKIIGTQIANWMSDLMVD